MGILLVSLGACGGEEASGPAAQGRSLASEKGCVNCHSADGSESVGPTWKGLAGSRVRLSDGTAIEADDAYLQESIQQPSARTVAGYPQGLMETVIKPGVISDEHAEQLIAYIKSLE